MDIIANRDVASPVLTLVKPESASGVVTLDLPSCRAFAANEPRWHRGCSDCSYDGTSERIVYNHFRYYDPSTGRYITSDRIGLGDGPNTYGYAGQNPLIYIDPLGLAYSPRGEHGLSRQEALTPRPIKDECGCFAKAFLGYTEAGVAATGAATGPYVNKPRGGIAGGGRAGSKTSALSTAVHRVNKRYGKNAATAAVRGAGRLASRAIPYVGTALLIYDIAVFNECMAECDDCQQ